MPPGTDVTTVEVKKPGKASKKEQKEIVLKNTAGQEVPLKDYFFNGHQPIAFHEVCGYPVDREDLVEIFDRIFDPKYNFLFYKTRDKEVYIIIVPLKNSTSVSAENESIDGDFQKHAISFVAEGSVNADTLRMKLRRILPFVKLGDS